MWMSDYCIDLVGFHLGYLMFYARFFFLLQYRTLSVLAGSKIEKLSI